MITKELTFSVIAAIELIAQGWTKTDACGFVNVSVRNFNRCLLEVPELAMELETAEDTGYDIMADNLLHIDSDPKYGSSDAKMAAVKMKAITWYLERRRRKKYGQHVTVDQTLSMDRAIIDILQRSKDRARTASLEHDTLRQLPSPVEDAIVILETEEELEARELARLLA